MDVNPVDIAAKFTTENDENPENDPERIALCRLIASWSAMLGCIIVQEEPESTNA